MLMAIQIRGTRMARKRFVVLDRDGTVIVERHYLSDPNQVELLPGTAQGLKHLAEMGLGLVLVTNQSGVGRGYFSEERLAEIHHRLEDVLSQVGIRLDGIYYCPHVPDDQCSCRKPEPGMLKQAAQELGFDLKDCFVVGDKPCDIELGQRVGATTFLVKTGYGADVAAKNTISPHYVVDDLRGVAQTIQQSLLIVDGGVRDAIRS